MSTEGGATTAREVIHVHQTWVAHRRHDRGLVITVIPAEAVPGEAPKSVEDIVGPMGLEAIHPYRDPSEAVALSCLAALLRGYSATTVMHQVEAVLRSGRTDAPLLCVDDVITGLVEHCAKTAVVVMETPKIAVRTLADALVSDCDPCIAALGDDAGAALVGVVGLGTVLLVTVNGRPATVVGARAGAWVGGTVGDDERTN